MAQEIRTMDFEYETRHRQFKQQYDSVMQAQRVKIEDIPLPDMNAPPVLPASYFAAIPLAGAPPNFLAPPPPVMFPPQPTKSILKQTDEAGGLSSSGTRVYPRQPPGAPPGSPPDLSDFECDDDENELGLKADDQYKPNEIAGKKIRFSELGPEIKNIPPPLPPGQQIPLPPTHIPPPLAAPSHMPTPSAAAASKSTYGGVLPGHHYAPPPLPPSQKQKTSHSHNNQSSTSNAASSGLSTIEAKPVLRNKVAEVTKFVPTSLLIRRDPNKKTHTSEHEHYHHTHHQQQHQAAQSSRYYDNYSHQGVAQSSNNSSNQSAKQTKSADAAYESFMKEIGGLL
jgi:hypothetical protein